ncbi:hypothetical protein P280DRAFT_481786 [Massarina eburnea CBS 473.64]|uniref:Uncharacterized protein n=1 Tax=Massarina eburnea CBS 473.64 TaxID=1395130 RepID=A0A6A6RV07_9PLEO|nr:hypothetical protein P280DRAFT_481786 [Massarina eburnea CBS 473.64]
MSSTTTTQTTLHAASLSVVTETDAIVRPKGPTTLALLQNGLRGKFEKSAVADKTIATTKTATEWRHWAHKRLNKPAAQKANEQVAETIEKERRIKELEIQVAALQLDAVRKANATEVKLAALQLEAVRKDNAVDLKLATQDQEIKKKSKLVGAYKHQLNANAELARGLLDINEKLSEELKSESKKLAEAANKKVKAKEKKIEDQKLEIQEKDKRITDLDAKLDAKVEKVEKLEQELQKHKLERGKMARKCSDARHENSQLTYRVKAFRNSLEETTDAFNAIFPPNDGSSAAVSNLGENPSPLEIDDGIIVSFEASQSRYLRHTAHYKKITLALNEGLKYELAELTDKLEGIDREIAVGRYYQVMIREAEIREWALAANALYRDPV